jgi:thymidylate kinase
MSALLRALESLGSYVVLRNYDVLANIATGGDVDLLVPDRQHAEEQLIARLGTPVYIVRRSYVTGLFYDWGQIDLLSTLEWRGARYLDAASVLKDRDARAGQPRPRAAHEALISWFSSLLWGGFFKARYRNVIVQALDEDGAEFARVLQTAVGKRWTRRLWLCAAHGQPEESELWAGQLRRAVLHRAFVRAPLQTIAGRCRFYFAELKLHMNPPLPLVVILGPDGSGKSTVLAGLRDQWPRSLGTVHTYHYRPYRLAPRKRTSEPVIDPHGQPPRNAFMSAAALMVVVTDWWIGYWTRIVRQRAKSGLVVFDRHLLDVVVDPLRYRYGGPAWLPRLMCRLAPRPDAIAVLDADPAVIRARKQEVTVAESQRQTVEYRRLHTVMRGVHLVDTAKPPQQVVDSVMTIVRRHVQIPILNRSGARTSRRDT